MHQELSQIKSVEEIKKVFSENSENKIFTENEFKSVEKKNKIRSLGARYIIKKLILDDLVLEDRFKDIEILNEESGKPYISFKNDVKEILKKKGISNVSVSISHSRNFITGMVILEKDV